MDLVKSVEVRMIDIQNFMDKEKRQAAAQ